MIRFEHPSLLALLLLIVPLFVIAWRSRRHEPTWRWIGSLLIRTSVVVLMVAALAQPGIARSSHSAATVFVLDRSASVPTPLLNGSRRFVDQLASGRRDPKDRVGFVTVARDAEIKSAPNASDDVLGEDHAGARDGSDLASGVRLALSLLPPDASQRVVLVSDGNETSGDLLSAADEAAARGVPIDVVPMDYSAVNEVVFDSLRAPSRARPAQTADLRLVLRSQRGARGTVFLRESGQPVDLDPASPGNGLAVELEPGPRTIVIPFPLGESGLHRFDAVFEPSDPSADGSLENNRASAMTMVEGSGGVLVIDPSGGTESAAFAAALKQSSIEAVVMDPAEIPADAAFLSGFDAIVLANTARWRIDGELDRLLRSYVHDLGGGLIMMGGTESFGAGGWISSNVSEALPLRLDPPATRAMLRGSVAIVLDASGSMASPAMGDFAHKQAMANEAAAAGVQSMSRLDEVCVIAFDGAPNIVVPRRSVGPDAFVERRIRGITSGGGTDLHAAMHVALKELSESTAGTKHMVILTDGMTLGEPEEGIRLAELARDADITVSTIGIEEGAKDPTLARIAAIGGGRFHPVTDLKTARELPRIFMREFHTAGRRLTIEGDFQPTVLQSSAGPLRGVLSVPQIRGYVVCLPREGLAQIDIVQNTSEGLDPIFASWNYGLGRSAAFTSDLGTRWAREWPSWGEYRAFWEQTARWLMRPAAPANVTTRSRIDGETAIVDLEILRPDGSFDPSAEPRGVLISPTGAPVPLQLEQIRSGRWQARFSVAASGSYLVNFALGVDEAGRRLSAQATVHAAYPREYRTVEGNRALLERVAERTRGRVIELSTPAAGVDAFLRSPVARPLATRGVWDLLAILAAGLFLLDIAFRRLVFDWADVTTSIRGGIALHVPGAESLRALRSARTRREEQAPTAPDPRPRPSWLDKPTHEHPGAADQRQLGSLGVKPADVPAIPDAEAQADDELDTSARLLKAKRRAGDAYRDDSV